MVVRRPLDERADEFYGKDVHHTPTRLTPPPPRRRRWGIRVGIGQAMFLLLLVVLLSIGTCFCGYAIRAVFFF